MHTLSHSWKAFIPCSDTCTNWKSSELHEYPELLLTLALATSWGQILKIYISYV